MNNNLVIKYNINVLIKPELKSISEFTINDFINIADNYGIKTHKLYFYLMNCGFNNFANFCESITYKYNKDINFIFSAINKTLETITDNENFTTVYKAVVFELLATEKRQRQQKALKQRQFAQMQINRIKSELTACLSAQNKKRINNLLKYQSLINESMLDI